MIRTAVVLALTLGLVAVVAPVGAETHAQKTYLLAQGAPTVPAATAPGYADVADIIAKYHCTVCHGAVEPRSGLSLDSYKGMMQGGKHGPIIKAGAAGESELIRRIKGTSEPRMPMTGPPWASDSDIGTIERWIQVGAPEGKK
jgi:hypothetical protein